VDDDSPDGTGRIALERAAVEPRLHVLVRHGRRGLGSAIVEGFRAGHDRGFDVAVNMDADFSHDPADIPRLLAALEPVGGRPAAVVVGSRRVPGGHIVGWPLKRHAASRMVSWFTRWVLRVPIRDASSGFRAVRLDVFAALPGPFAEGYAFQEDMLWRVHRAGGRLAEVPITFEDRKAGVSKADLAESRRSIGELLQLAWRTWLG
jgi:glycosyltransferase involved in cell wall biosynthesis